MSFISKLLAAPVEPRLESPISVVYSGISQEMCYAERIQKSIFNVVVDTPSA